MNYIQRSLESVVSDLFKVFPVVTIVGSRQVGKTMLAQHLYPDWKHFDLERYDHLDRVSGDLEFFFQSEVGDICFDEAQRLPALFSHLRTIVDRYPERKFLLLGSASPQLLTAISESLAGRSATAELSPLSLTELPDLEIPEHWQYGGYPRLRYIDPEQRIQWVSEYIRQTIERDIPALGISISSDRLKRLLSMLAHCHGGVLNISRLASSLSCSTTAVYDALDALEKSFVIRRLQPFSVNLGKRLVKAPKVYIRDAGVLHTLLRIGSRDELLGHPSIGASWEGYVVEQLIVELQNRGRRFDIYFYRTHAGTEVDAVLEIGARRILIEVKLGDVKDRRSLKGMNTSMDDLGADEGLIITYSGDSYQVTEKIRQVSLRMALEQMASVATGME